LLTIALLRLSKETGASKAILILAWVATSVAILLFAWYTLMTSPQTFAILVGTIILAWVIEAVWRSISKRKFQAKEEEAKQP
jgi:hypothetical protein